jgi:hypothetical protein
MMVIVEQSMEWRLAEETEVLGENLPQHTYLLTYSWSWALLEEPPILQLLKNFPAFTEPEGSLPCSQEPFTGPYPEPAH